MLTLSVIIPTKNEERYLPRLLEALKQQTYTPLQIIVADAKSTDRTRELAEQSGCLVVDGGLPGPGRNAGAKAATGDLLFFIDADAIIEDREFFAKAIAEFTERNFDIATADIYLEQGSKFEHAAHRFYNWYVRWWGSRHPHAPGFCILMRRRVFEAIHGFDETVLLAEDHDLVGRAGKIGAFGILNNVKMGASERRLRRDGWFKLLPTYIFGELHMLSLGPIRHNFFRYDFGYDSQGKAPVKPGQK